MGSEKKKKEKKKDKKRKHKRDRSRSESPERKERKHHKHEATPEYSDNLEKSSLSVDDSNKLRAKLGLKPLEEPKREEKIEGDRNVISLSVQETNKLREKLGLKPLDVGNKSGDVHVPAKNMSKILETEKLANKLKMVQEKRRIKQQLSRVKSLGTASSDLTDTLAWVQKSRTLASKKAAAEAQTKLLDSMDDEFGVGELVENERFGKQYSSRDLKDLTVLHDISSFKEGNMTILTLQDKEILAEDGDDVLVNVNMMDDERTLQNNENKKTRPDYNPYEDFDEEGNFKGQKMLSKYDEVIQGEQKKSFKISETSDVEKIRRRMAAGLPPQKVGNVSLDVTHLRVIGKEYYTTDEVAAFKKPRKKKMRKIRKTMPDEIMPLHTEDKSEKNHGSRSGKRDKRDKTESKTARKVDTSENMEIDIELDDEVPQTKKGDGKISERELYSIQIEEDDSELEAALARSRRSNLLKEKSKNILKTVSELEPALERIPGISKTSQIVLDQTAEFAKGIGAEDDTVPLEMAPPPEVMETEDTELVKKISDWKDVDFVTATFGEFTDYDQSRAEQQDVIEAEPSLQRGLSGALQVAQRKGFIDTNKGVTTNKDINDAVKATGSVRARVYQVDRDTGQDIDSRRRGDREYSSGQFPEKRGYNPDVKIVYTDNIGRELNSKEAFRQLSHKFHGKGSGKMKTEKRMKKTIEQMALKKMDSDDTPLGSAALLREKQKDGNCSYIVLSGGNRIPNDLNGNITKLSKK